MSTVTANLLVFPTDQAWRNAFSFDHAMAHRNLMAVMGPLNQWSVMPYFVDPTMYQARPATKWPLNHQQAHDDFNRTLPAYGAAQLRGIPTAQILIDSNMQDQGSRAWWMFANHQEHKIAATAVNPRPAPPPTPWWWAYPYLVQTFW